MGDDRSVLEKTVNTVISENIYACEIFSISLRMSIKLEYTLKNS